MRETPTFDELKRLAEGKPATEEITFLYLEAFETFGVKALWSRTPSVRPTIAQALVVADTLRREGDMTARPLAVEIEQACRAAL